MSDNNDIEINATEEKSIEILKKDDNNIVEKDVIKVKKPMVKTAGIKKGFQYPETLVRKKGLRAVKARIAGHAQRLINAQLQLAYGCSVLYKIVEIDGKTKHVIVKEDEEIRQYLDREFEGGAVHYYIAKDKPDNKAIDSLLNRSFGKPIQGIEGTINVTNYDQLTDGQLDEQLGQLQEAAVDEGSEDGEIEEITDESRSDKL